MMDSSEWPHGVALDDDPQSLESASLDFGRIVSRKPRSVARPRSAEDVQRVIEHAIREGFAVSTQGTAHSQGGQSLIDDGILLDLKGLDRIGEVDGSTVLVQAGTRWRDLVHHVHARGYLPMALTTNLSATVGGTLSMAGLSASSHVCGTQTDNVDELEVVAGDGRLVRCSPGENTPLFDCTRCGLGQFSIITEARVRLRRARSMVRTYVVFYDEPESLMKDLELVMTCGRFQFITVYCQPLALNIWEAAQGRSPFSRRAYRMELGVEFDTEPNQADVLGDLHHRSVIRVEDAAALAYADRMSPRPGARIWGTDWSMAHPNVEGFLPWDRAGGFVSDLLLDLPVELVQRCLVVMGPFRGELLDSPMLMRPQGEFILALGLLPELPPADLPSVQPILERVSHAINELGGKRYLSGWIDYRHEQWKAHYGENWQRVLNWKRSFDPHGILNPGFVKYAPE